MIEYKKSKFIISYYDIENEKSDIFVTDSETEFNDKIMDLENNNCDYDYIIESNLIF